MARVVLLLMALLAAAPARADTQAPATPAITIPTALDPADRLTVPVTINGQGPFAFVVDTGADRTVISRELAARLHLALGADVPIHGSSGVRLAPTVLIDSLSVGTRTLTRLQAPVLAAAWLGADGMLGVDAVRDQAVVLDFPARRLTVRPIPADQDDPGAIVVTATNRYGQLILLDATVADQKVFVILDSGAQTTIANSVFRRRFGDGMDAQEGHNPVGVLSVIGGTTAGQAGTIPQLSLGELALQDLPVVYADLYTFALFHLDRRPAMLLGMNALHQFSRVAIDYRHRQVTFSPLHAQSGEALRQVTAGTPGAVTGSRIH